MSTAPVPAATRAESTRRVLALAVGLASAALVVSTAPAAHAESRAAAPEDLRIDELKRVYLSCNSAALRGRLDTAAVRQCSVVYEALKRRAFDGDFGKLLAWSRTQPDVRLKEN
ncbi:MAG: hypothetical protein KJ025_06810 [Burkholderiales bacterium]|nr:hypothetical protein [Burkholderiales bacterium]